MSWPINISTGLPGGPIQYLGFGGAGSLVIAALGVGASAADVDAGTTLIVAGVFGFFVLFLIGLVILLWGRHFVTDQDFQRVDAENAKLVDYREVTPDQTESVAQSDLEDRRIGL